MDQSMMASLRLAKNTDMDHALGMTEKITLANFKTAK
jgi:hypothetical protein